MPHITRSGLETCLAFGEAALAVAEVAELIGGQLPEGSARDLLLELETAHDRLRILFDLGQDTAVHALGLSVLVLADRTAGAIREDRNLSDS